MSPFPRPEYGPLDRYAPDRRPVATDLSDNTSLRGPHPAARMALREASDEDLTRYPSVYADAFREAAARHHGIPPESVVTGCGSDDLLDSAFRAVAAPGEGVAYLTPTFSMVEIFARMNALEPTPVPRGAPGEPLPSPARLLEADPALVYLCSPNNPTGEVLPPEWVEELLDAGGPRGPVVLLDEAYADFAEGSLASRAPATERLMVLRTLSKAYGLAGLRLGYALGSEEVVAEVEKSRGPYKVSRPAEAAAQAALDDDSGWVAQGVEEARESRRRLVEELEERGFRPPTSGANFVLVPLDEGKDAARLTAELRDEGVAVRPFPALPGVGEAVRVTVGPWSLMERFLEALDRTGASGPGLMGASGPEARDQGDVR